MRIYCFEINFIFVTVFIFTRMVRSWYSSRGLWSCVGYVVRRDVLGYPLRLYGRSSCSFSCAHTASSRTLWSMFTRVLLPPLSTTGSNRRAPPQWGSPHHGPLPGQLHSGYVRGCCRIGTIAGGTFSFLGPFFLNCCFYALSSFTCSGSHWWITVGGHRGLRSLHCGVFRFCNFNPCMTV